MSKDKKELSEKRDYRAIIATFIKEGGDKIGTVVKSKPANEKERVEWEAKFKEHRELIDKIILELTEENQQMQKNLTDKEKEDRTLFAGILLDKANDLSNNRDSIWDLSGYITDNTDFLGSVMDLRIPGDSKKTIKEMINAKAPNVASRIRNNNKFQGMAAKFILYLYRDDCVFRKNMTDLSDPKNLKRSIEEIDKSTQDIIPLIAEIQKLRNVFDTRSQLSLNSSEPLQRDNAVNESTAAVAKIKDAYKKLEINYKLIKLERQHLINIHKSYVQQKKNLENMSNGDVLEKYEIEITMTEMKLKNLTKKLHKNSNDLKEQINQNLKKLESSQGNVVSNKDGKGNEILPKKIELLQKEVETLKKEYQALKPENQALKKAQPIASNPVQKPISPTSASTQAASPAATPAKVTPIIAQPALPPTPPKSTTTAIAANPTPIPSVAANPAKSPTAAKPVSPPPVPSSAPKPAATLVKPTTQPPNKPASPVAGPTAASAKTSTTAPTAKTPATAAAPLNVLQQVAALNAKTKEAAAAKAVQAGGSKPKPPSK